jgi:hypothetical protein
VKDKAIGKNMLAQSKQMELKYQRVEVYHDKYTEDSNIYKDGKDYKVKVMPRDPATINRGFDRTSLL